MKQTTQINGNIITEFREKNNLTQDKFARNFNSFLNQKGIKANYTNKTISMWENGNREPKDIQTFKALADFLEVSVETLCTYDENNDSACLDSEVVEECSIKMQNTNGICDNEDNIMQENSTPIESCDINFDLMPYDKNFLISYLFGKPIYYNFEDSARLIWVFLPFDISQQTNSFIDDSLSIWDMEEDGLNYSGKSNLNPICLRYIANKNVLGALGDCACDKKTFDAYNVESIKYCLNSERFKQLEKNMMFEDISNFIVKLCTKIRVINPFEVKSSSDVIAMKFTSKIAKIYYTRVGLLAQFEIKFDISREQFNMMKKTCIKRYGFEKMMDIYDANSTEFEPEEVDSLAEDLMYEIEYKNSQNIN